MVDLLKQSLRNRVEPFVHVEVRYFSEVTRLHPAKLW